VIALAGKVEKILGDVEQLAAFDVLAELFLHLSNDRGRRLLAHFDPASRQGPVRVARRTVHEYVTRMKNDCGGANLKALAVKMD
jgi:hypothetical protein